MNGLHQHTTLLRAEQLLKSKYKTISIRYVWWSYYEINISKPVVADWKSSIWEGWKSCGDEDIIYLEVTTINDSILNAWKSCFWTGSHEKIYEQTMMLYQIWEI